MILHLHDHVGILCVLALAIARQLRNEATVKTEKKGVGRREGRERKWKWKAMGEEEEKNDLGWHGRKMRREGRNGGRLRWWADP